MPRSPERQAAEERRGELSNEGAAVEAQAKAIVDMCAVTQEDPAEMLRSIAADLGNLPPAEQAIIRERFPFDAAEAAEPQPAQPEVLAPAAPDKTKTEKPHTWLFDNYVLKQDPETGAFLIFENKSKYDEREKQYKPYDKPQPTTIKLPRGMSERLQQDPELGRQIIEFCEKLRRRLGELGGNGGLALPFDKRDSKGQEWQPKWKYTLDDILADKPARDGSRVKPRETQLRRGNERWTSDSKKVDNANQLPPNLYDMAESYWQKNFRGEAGPSDRYWLKRLWKSWYGKAIQRKREDIISEELGKRRFETVAGAGSVTPENRPIETTPMDESRDEEQVTRTRVPEEPPMAVPEPAPVRADRTEEPDAAPEKRETERRDEELLDFSQPIARKLLPVIAELYPGSEKEDKLALIKHVTKSTLDILKDRYGRVEDAEALDRIWRMSFVEKLSGVIAKEFNRLETARRFFDEHSVFDENSVEVTGRNSIVMTLDRTAEPEALMSAARQLVFDAFHEPGKDGEKGDEMAGDEARLIRLVADALRRLKDTPADVVEYDGKAGKLNITDLETMRRVIKSKARTPKG